jgi:hypothetical protein
MQASNSHNMELYHTSPTQLDFMLLLQKNSAELNRFSGVPIVVALEMNIYNNPGHNSSIDFFPGLTTIHGIG